MRCIKPLTYGDTLELFISTKISHLTELSMAMVVLEEADYVI